MKKSIGCVIASIHRILHPPWEKLKNTNKDGYVFFLHINATPPYPLGFWNGLILGLHSSTDRATEAKSILKLFRSPCWKLYNQYSCFEYMSVHFRTSLIARRLALSFFTLNVVTVMRVSFKGVCFLVSSDFAFSSTHFPTPTSIVTDSVLRYGPGIKLLLMSIFSIMSIITYANTISSVHS